MELKNLSIEELDKLFNENKYIADENINTVVFLSLMLQKPILIEGPPGVGKTELSKVIAKMFNLDFFRIQCYEGINFEQMVGEWDYQKQLLEIEKTRTSNINSKEIFSEEFFIKRPLLSAFMNEKDSIILIDEIDKSDEEVESFLLQALGEKEITVNDLGTFSLLNNLVVVLTSNAQRVLLDETKDRCLFLYIDYPSPEKEKEIIQSKVPDAPNHLVEKIVSLISQMRSLNLVKKPSIRASVDWVKSYMIMGNDKPDNTSLKNTLNVVLKNQEDKNKVLKHMFKNE